MKNRKAKILLVRRNAPSVWQWVRLSNRRMGLMKYYGMMDCGFAKSPARRKTAGKTTYISCSEKPCAYEQYSDIQSG